MQSNRRLSCLVQGLNILLIAYAGADLFEMEVVGYSFEIAEGVGRVLG